MFKRSHARLRCVFVVLVRFRRVPTVLGWRDYVLGVLRSSVHPGECYLSCWLCFSLCYVFVRKSLLNWEFVVKVFFRIGRTYRNNILSLRYIILEVENIPH